jgi:hypothetical protein
VSRLTRGTTYLHTAGPLFVLLFGLAFGLEKPSRRTPCAILLICTGLALVSCDRLTLPDRPIGILLGTLSLTFSGLRWALTQVLTAQKQTHPLSTTLHAMPVVGLGALVCTFALEREVFSKMAEFASDDRLSRCQLACNHGVLMSNACAHSRGGWIGFVATHVSRLVDTGCLSISACSCVSSS